MVWYLTSFDQLNVEILNIQSKSEALALLYRCDSQSGKPSKNNPILCDFVYGILIPILNLVLFGQRGAPQEAVLRIYNSYME